MVIISHTTTCAEFVFMILAFRRDMQVLSKVLKYIVHIRGCASKIRDAIRFNQSRRSFLVNVKYYQAMFGMS